MLYSHTSSWKYITQFWVAVIIAKIKLPCSQLQSTGCCCSFFTCIKYSSLHRIMLGLGRAHLLSSKQNGFHFHGGAYYTLWLDVEEKKRETLSDGGFLSMGLIWPEDWWVSLKSLLVQLYKQHSPWQSSKHQQFC